MKKLTASLNYSFRGLVGQVASANELRHSFAANRLNHSYLLEGLVGCGKMTLARALAGRFLCHNPGADSDACGNCQSCKMLQQSSHPDYLELPREPRELRIRRFVERDGGTEEISHPPVLTFMRLKPMLQHGKVCIIPEAERMNQEAANAFLKTLEEPPAGSLIILTSAARDRVLGTIVSRCRRVGLAPLAEDEIAQELIRRGEPADRARMLAALAEGSLGQALTATGGEAAADWEWIDAVLADNTPAQAVKLGEELSERVRAGKDGESRRLEALRLFDLIALYIRRKLREGLSPRAAAAALLALWEGGERLAANVRPELVLYTASLEIMAALKRA